MKPVCLRDLIGQPYVTRLLRQGIAKDRLAHAYFFVGPDGTGRSTAARSLARALNCPVDPDGCGECPSCLRANAGLHPDIKHIESKNSLGIDCIRDLRKDAWLKPTEGEYKVYILEGAESLTAEASNGLLKILEEPPEGCVLILIASDNHSLPETVLSRCQVVPFRPVARRYIEEFLLSSGVPREDACLIAAYSRGIVGRAADLVASKQFKKKRDYAFEIACKTLTVQGAGALDLAEELDTTREEVLENLDALVGVYRDAMMWRLTGTMDLAESPGMGEALAPLGDTVSLLSLYESVRAILEIRTQIQKNANRRMALEVLVFRLAALARRGI